MIPSFHPNLFHGGFSTLPLSLRAKQADTEQIVYAIESTNKTLCNVVGSPVQPAPWVETLDLKKISVFVKSVLAYEEGMERILADKTLSQRVCLYFNLQDVRSAALAHNEKVGSDCWLQFVHVLLLVLTLGIFSYKEQFLVGDQEMFAVSLKDFCPESAPRDATGLETLPLSRIVEMAPAEQELLFARFGAEKDLPCLRQISSLPEELLMLFSFSELQKVLDYLNEFATSPETYVVKGTESFRQCAVLCSKLSLDGPAEKLEGDVSSWKDLPFQKLLRMLPEQFALYCDSFASEALPVWVSLFPVSCRKYALENSKTLQDPNVPRYFKADECAKLIAYGNSSVFDQRALLADLSFETQCKISPPFMYLLPRSFFQKLDWKTMPCDTCAFYLGAAPIAFFADLPVETVKRILEKFDTLAYSFCLPDGSLANVLGSGPQIGHQMTPEVMKRIGLDWFLESTHKAVLLDALLFTNPELLREVAPSAAQVKRIVQDPALFMALPNFLLSKEDWDKFSVDELLSFSIPVLEVCFGQCSDAKLAELVAEIEKRSLPIYGLIPWQRTPLGSEIYGKKIAELVSILKDQQAFALNQQLFTTDYWEIIPAEEILACEEHVLQACFAQCSDVKLAEIVKEAAKRSIDIHGLILWERAPIGSEIRQKKVDHLVAILKREGVVAANQHLFSIERWEDIPAEEILACEESVLRACFAQCSDEKLVQIAEKAIGEGKFTAIEGLIPIQRSAALTSVWDSFSAEEKVSRAGFLDGVKFLYDNALLPLHQLAFAVLTKKGQVTPEVYKGFWAALEGVTHIWIQEKDGKMTKELRRAFTGMGPLQETFVLEKV